MATATPVTSTPVADDTATPTQPADVMITGTLLASLKAGAQGLATAESNRVKAIAKASADTFGDTVDAYATFGQALKAIVKVMGEDFSTIGGKAVQTYVLAHVAESDRATLPVSDSSYVKALQAARWDAKAKRAAFLKAGNAADMDVYGPWLQMSETGKLGSNRSAWDLKASLADPSDWDDTANAGKGGVKPGAKFGQLVKRGAPGQTPGQRDVKGIKPAKAVKAILSMSRADLLKVEPPVAVVIPPAMLEAFTCYVLAQHLLAQPVADDAAATITIG